MDLLVNGEKRTIEAPSDTPLLWVIREDLGLTGTKYGCGIGACGACSVMIDGALARACTVPVGSVEGEVRTIENVAGTDGQKIVAQWEDMDVPQCGYCQPGMVMAATALLQHTPNPTDQEIEVAMTNICRCGTYPRILAAIKKAAADV